MLAIWVKTGSIIKEISINNVKLDSYLKNIFSKDITDNYTELSMEKSLSVFESDVAPSIQRLIGCMNPRFLSVKDKVAISAFCANILLRNPLMKKMHEWINNTTKVGKFEKISPITRQFSHKVDKDTLKFASINTMCDLMSPITMMLFKKEWCVAHSEFGAWLCTSDNPLLICNNNMESSLSLTDSEGLICLPLNRYLMLIMSECCYSVSGRFYLRPDTASIFNQLLENTATKYVFAANKYELSKAMIAVTLRNSD